MNGVERSNDGVKLKSCPFCGGEARIEAEYIGKEKYLYSVSCINDCVTQGIYHKTVDSAIKAWNTRTPVEKVIERLEEEYSQDVGYLKMISVDKAIEIIKEEMGHGKDTDK